MQFRLFDEPMPTGTPPSCEDSGVGFTSTEDFRAALTRLVEAAGGEVADEAVIRSDWIATPIGPLIAIADPPALLLLEFPERKALPGEIRTILRAACGRIAFGRHRAIDRVEAELAAYFAGRAADFATPLAPIGSPFTQAVWAALGHVPAGAPTTYGALAAQMGRPSATRAVARANGANPIAILIPCHRLVGADGSLTGYGGGIWRKRWLLDHERRYFGPSPTFATERTAT